MNQVLKCAVCVANRNALTAAAQADGQMPDLAAMPPVQNAVTIFGGHALCAGHIIAQQPRPGDQARQAGLIVPG